MHQPKLRGYAVERLLGSGGSGDVWQARVSGSGARVALKWIRVADEQQRRRAESEAALLCALDHPNLVRLHALVPADDAMVLVLDLAEGGSLARLLGARGRLAAGEVITAVAPVAAAVAYLHDEGVVHGDVSAGNVLFTAAGVPLLADVGVARLTGADADAEATPSYVDPAVAAGWLPGPQSDVFMLGGLALHALTGSPPWVADTADAALARAASGEPTDFAERLAAAGAPPAMAEAICRALAADPSRRGTAADFALDLAHAGTAVAVELAAGRARGEPQLVPGREWTGPRHAARPAGSTTVGSGQLAEQPLSEAPGRPAFERPNSVPPAAGAPPPTRMVAPRPRPVVPRPVRRRLPSRRLLIGSGCALAAALAAGGTLWAQASGEPSHPAAQVETAGRGSDWARTLSALDADRARAFAARRPALLRAVYSPGPLLSADAALLRRIVPPGCGLAGVHTTYTAARAVQHGERAEVTVTARLAPSRLLCAGVQRGTAAGAGPTRLRLELVRTGSGWRISAQRPAG